MDVWVAMPKAKARTLSDLMAPTVIDIDRVGRVGNRRLRRCILSECAGVHPRPRYPSPVGRDGKPAKPNHSQR